MPVRVESEVRVPQPAWVYLRLVGAPGSEELRRLVSKKQKPIFASRVVPAVDHR